MLVPASLLLILASFAKTQNTGGSGKDYLQETETRWEGPWFTGSCKIAML